MYNNIFQHSVFSRLLDGVQSDLDLIVHSYCCLDNILNIWSEDACVSLSCSSIGDERMHESAAMVHWDPNERTNERYGQSYQSINLFGLT
jgi:hypothetical protein